MKVILSFALLLSITSCFNRSISETSLICAQTVMTYYIPYYRELNENEKTEKVVFSKSFDQEVVRHVKAMRDVNQVQDPMERKDKAQEHLKKFIKLLKHEQPVYMNKCETLAKKLTDKCKVHDNDPVMTKKCVDENFGLLQELNNFNKFTK